MISAITDEYFALPKNAGLNEKEALSCISRYSRDNARTPVQWNGQRQCRIYQWKTMASLNPNYKEINVASQEKRSGFFFFL